VIEQPYCNKRRSNNEHSTPAAYSDPMASPVDCSRVSSLCDSALAFERKGFFPRAAAMYDQPCLYDILRGPCGQIHTVVVGHCGTHLASNVQTFTTFGLNTKEAHALLRETVALSVKQLHSCVAAHHRLSASATAPVGVG